MLERSWEWIANLISRKPGWVFVGTVLLLTPLAIFGAYKKDQLSYGLLSDLGSDVTSVRGAKAVQKHFPAGAAGVATFLIRHDDLDLTNIRSGEKLSKFITEDLMNQAATLGIADVRSQSSPHGAEKVNQGSDRPFIRGGVGRNLAQKAYCSSEGELKGKLMRIDIVFETDPFARDAVTRLEQAKAAISDALHNILAARSGRARGRRHSCHRQSSRSQSDRFQSKLRDPRPGFHSQHSRSQVVH